MHTEQIHKHKRKRAKLREYPHPEKKIRYLDYAVDVVAVLFPLTMIPQIIEIWVHKQVEGISLLTWGLFFVFQIILISYAIAHKDKRLLLMWSLWALGEIIIIAGLLIRG